MSVYPFLGYDTLMEVKFNDVDDDVKQLLAPLVQALCDEGFCRVCVISMVVELVGGFGGIEKKTALLDCEKPNRTLAVSLATFKPSDTSSIVENLRLITNE
jgi:hypothetical protein